MSELSELEVVAFLQHNKDFFINNPELLHSLSVAVGDNAVVSLSDHKLQQLQAKNNRLSSQLKQLIENAQKSEVLLNRLVRILTELSLNTEREEFLRTVVGFVGKYFAADYFCVLLENADLVKLGVPNVTALEPAIKQLFKVFEKNNAPLSGRLSNQKMQALFGIDTQAKSAVVLPLGKEAKLGLIGFGSRDDAKFQSAHGSDVLQKLSYILSCFLSKHSGQGENSSGH